MGLNTGISWTDHTWNPWVGCIKVSEGCRNCYMYREQIRRGIDPTIIRRTSNATFNGPLNSNKWKNGSKVFVCSYSDFFIDHADAWRDEAWSIIRQRPDLIFQICTKRPERIGICIPPDWGDGYKNVWLGVTVEDDRYFERWGILANGVGAEIKFVSWEPALGPLPLFNPSEFPNWIIGGGESGPNARSAKQKWFEDAVFFSEMYGIPYFHKQNGGTKKINGIWGGDLIDGKQYHEFPEGG